MTSIIDEILARHGLKINYSGSKEQDKKEVEIEEQQRDNYGQKQIFVKDWLHSDYYEPQPNSNDKQRPLEISAASPTPKPKAVKSERPLEL